MASRRPSPTPRRVVALKRADGEPLTRSEVQYDLLNAIFGDSHSVFTDPYLTNGTQPGDKLCFRDLYIKSIFYSPKATKALKDKMTESSIFSLDFAMLSLLVNVGRINTTMSCQYPSIFTAYTLSFNINVSFSRNEDRNSNLSSDSVPAAHKREYA